MAKETIAAHLGKATPEPIALNEKEQQEIVALLQPYVESLRAKTLAATVKKLIESYENYLKGIPPPTKSYIKGELFMEAMKGKKTGDIIEWNKKPYVLLEKLGDLGYYVEELKEAT
jgi:hypothetical protein